MGKKLVWFLVVTFMVYVHYGTKLCLAEKSNDSSEIKMTIENFLNGYVSRDLDSMMQEVSPNYLEKRKEGVVDYSKFKSTVQWIMDSIYKKYDNYTVVDVSWLNLNIKSNEADVEVKYSWQATVIGIFEKKTGENIRTVGLVKEKDSWKIVQFSKKE